MDKENHKFQREIEKAHTGRYQWEELAAFSTEQTF